MFTLIQLLVLTVSYFFFFPFILLTNLFNVIDGCSLIWANNFWGPTKRSNSHTLSPADSHRLFLIGVIYPDIFCSKWIMNNLNWVIFVFLNQLSFQRMASVWFITDSQDGLWRFFFKIRLSFKKNSDLALIIFISSH